jgi:thymidylate synthase (FAD)
MKVKLVSKTQIAQSYLEELMKSAQEGDKEFIQNVQGPEALMTYIARVSSKSQKNPSYEGLLKYCMKHGHWSVFEQVNLTFEIETSRAIAAQILRHRSSCFQEFSQRYSKVDMGIEVYPARSQDLKNRQNSNDDMSDEDKQWFKEAQEKNYQRSFGYYCEALDRGIAKEQARFLLPQGIKTKLYMTNNVRNFIHYINLRSENGSQKEHADIAIKMKEILCEELPVVAKAAGWL